MGTNIGIDYCEEMNACEPTIGVQTCILCVDNIFVVVAA